MTRRGLLAALVGLPAVVLVPASPSPTVVELNLDGHVILQSLKKLKRERGGDLGLA